MTPSLTYAAITPTRNEAENLQRLAPCMISQTVACQRWIIVDNGSTDDTVAIAQALADQHSWITLLEIPGETVATRGAPVVRAFHAGVAGLPEPADVVVKLDADVTFATDYFERQLDAFEAEPTLGISAGVCMEPTGLGTWEPANVTRGHVRGAVRAYRWGCLQQVTPLEERMGWDGIDELKAQVNGWTIKTLPDLSFDHHRVLGSRESAWFKWARQGDMSHYMDYRFSYLLARTLYYMRSEPSAVAMLWGYGSAVLHRNEQCAAQSATAYLRKQQSLRALPVRVREKLGHAA